MARNNIKGMRDLEATFRELGKVPQTVATQSARAGGRIALKATRQNAPEDEGYLKQGIVLKREKTKVKGRAIYQVTFDARMNHIFVKVSKNGKRAYYPASQEYGYMTVDGGYVPGYRFMRRSADDNRREVERKMIEQAGKAVDKVLRKRGGGR